MDKGAVLVACVAVWCATLSCNGRVDVGALSADAGRANDGGTTAICTGLTSPSSPGTCTGSTLPGACGSPTLTPNDGAVALGSNVTIHAPTGFPATGDIFYTVDGTVPTHSSQLYSGPIQISQNTTIQAIAYASGHCTDSPVARQKFIVTLPEAGTLTAPIFNPPSTTENHDFLVGFSDGAPGATICFTTDGTTIPTCTVNGNAAVCGSESTTYNNGAGLNAPDSVSITPAITNATTGKVTIQAVACEVGATPTAVATQAYTLQVSPPTMQAPAPGNLPFTAGGYAPTAGSITAGAQIRFTTNGTAVACDTGTLLQTAMGIPQNPGNPPLTQNTTFSVIGCEPGYAPSSAVSFTYTITLDPPVLATAAGTYDSTFNPVLTTSATSNQSPVGTNAPGLYFCSSTTVGEPACGTTVGTCATGTAGTVPVTTTGTTFSAVACAPNFNGSAPASVAYSLQLSPPAINSPGCVATAGASPTTDCLTRANKPTIPATSYALPATAGAPFTIEQSPGAAANVPAGAIAAGAYAFVCAAKRATPACAGSSCSAGTIVPPASAGQSFTTGTGVPISNGGLTIAAEDTWNVIACPGSNPAFAPSPVTSVTFGGPGQALAPSIVPAAQTLNNALTATLLNTDPSSILMCYTTNGTEPTCTDATHCGAGSTSCATTAPAGSANVTSLTLTSPGSGYTSAPTVTIAPPLSGTQATATATVGYPIASIQVMSAGDGCPTTRDAPGPAVQFNISGGTIAAGGAAAVIPQGILELGNYTVSGPNNSLTAINANVFSSTGFYVTPPTITVTGCDPNNEPTATAVLSTTGSVAQLTVTDQGSGYSTIPAVTIAGNATATASLNDTCTVGPLNTNPTTVTAVTCGGQTSPPAASSYTFQLAEPTFWEGTTNVTSGGPVAIGGAAFATVTLELSPTPADLRTLFVCWTTDGTTPSCACTGGSQTISEDSYTLPFQQPIDLTAPTTTVKAIACDSATANAWQPSAVRSTAFTLALPTPVLNVPAGTYENSPTVTIANGYPGNLPDPTVFCYTTTPGATPTCSAGACTGGALPLDTSGYGVLVTSTGTSLNFVACYQSMTSAPTGASVYTLNVTPVAVLNTETAEVSTPIQCGRNGAPNVVIGLDCSVSGGVCNSTDVAQGGPTFGPDTWFCYSTTSTVVGCQTTNPPSGVTCVEGTAGNPPPTASLTIDTSTTISTAACLVGTSSDSFNTATSTLTVTPPSPFRFTPTIDGNLSDWTTASTAAGMALSSNSADTGYFAYDRSDYYFAYNNDPAAATEFITIYVGNASSTTVGTQSLIGPDACPTSAELPAGTNAQYAVTIETDNNAVTTYAWSATGGDWGSPAPTLPASAVSVASSGTSIEISIPMADVGGITQPNVVGALVERSAAGCTGSIGSRTKTLDTWPNTDTGANYIGYVSADTASCAYPNDTSNIK